MPVIEKGDVAQVPVPADLHVLWNMPQRFGDHEVWRAICFNMRFGAAICESAEVSLCCPSQSMDGRIKRSTII